jgi:hypothetical protein
MILNANNNICKEISHLNAFSFNYGIRELRQNGILYLTYRLFIGRNLRFCQNRTSALVLSCG